MFIADNIDSPICDTTVNKVLTLLGFLHICMQPYFCHVINASLTKNAKYIDRYVVIKRLCVIGGGMLFARHFLAPYWSTMDFKRDGMYASTEWLRGEKLCTFRYDAHKHATDHAHKRCAVHMCEALPGCCSLCLFVLFFFFFFCFFFVLPFSLLHLSSLRASLRQVLSPPHGAVTLLRHATSTPSAAHRPIRPSLRRCGAVQPRTCAAAR